MANLYTQSGANSVPFPSDNNLTAAYTGLDISGVSSDGFTIEQGVTITTGAIGVQWSLQTGLDVEDYGDFLLTNAAQVNGTSSVIVNYGGTIELSSFSAHHFGALEFGSQDDGVGGLIALDYGQSLSVMDAVKGIADGDMFLLQGINADGVTYGNGSFTLTLSGLSTGYTFSVNFDGTFHAMRIANPDGSYSTLLDAEPCFLPGVRLRTPSGDVAVEDIRIGDSVVAYRPDTGEDEVRDVTWVGRQTATVRAGRPDDQAGCPVRILRDAIAEGVPSRDLLVTAEHCLFLDGKFIPARMLINGRTIIYDRSFASYDFFHVETDRHAVIYADGMRTESYLDTGNRRDFATPGQVVRFPSTARSWQQDAAAPLATDEATVKPIWDALAHRAAAVSPGIAPAATAETTTDPDLRLVVGGRTIRPTGSDGNRVLFVLPRGMDRARLVSRSARPADSRPWLDDRRQLGVAVAGLRVRMGSDWHDIAIDDPSLGEGWWDAEQAGNATWRWTDGAAHLPLGARFTGTILEVSLHAVAEYRLISEDNAAMPARTAAGA